MNRRDQQHRTQIAQLAARLMLDAGNRDYANAKRKAAQKLGIRDKKHLPGNDEIEQALVEYLRIFRADDQQQCVARLRKEALRAMQFLEDFSPRLVGSVLSGSADEHSAIHLHVFTDDPDGLALFLMHHHIPYETGERNVRWASGTSRMMPLMRFLAGDSRIELTVFPANGLREPPLSPVDGRTLQRADARTVSSLVDSAGNTNLGRQD